MVVEIAMMIDVIDRRWLVRNGDVCRPMYVCMYVCVCV